MTPLLPEAKHDWKVLVYLTGKPGKLLIFLSFQKDDICFVQTLAIRFAMLAGKFVDLTMGRVTCPVYSLQ